MEGVIAFLGELPLPLVYIVLGVGAAVENIVPALPADSVILAGGFAAGAGVAHATGVFLVVCTFNIGGALGVYALGRRHGQRFFRTGPGRRLLTHDELVRLERFYERWGVAAIFAGRFLPGFRAAVPVFAGVARVGWFRTVLPITAASAIWYGALVGVGHAAGANREAVVDAVSTANRGLLGASAALALLVSLWWWRRRRSARRHGSGGR